MVAAPQTWQVPPGLASGFATRGESAQPDLWRGIIGAWVPALGVQQGGNTLRDLSGHGRHGTLVAGTIWQPSPVNAGLGLYTSSAAHGASMGDGDAFSFGNSSVDVPFSVAAWFYLVSVASGFVILAKLSNGSPNYEWEVNTYFMTCRDAGATYIGRSAPAPATGALHHMVWTYDGSSTNGGVRIYRNGVRVDNANFGSGVYVAMENGTAPLAIGGNANGAITGHILDVRLWRNRALTEAEQRRLYLDRWGMFQPQARRRFKAAAAAGFNPAWARNSNVILGAGAA